MVTHAPSIALRIAWTSGRLWSAGAKVLLALASCGDFETGRRCYPNWATLVARSGLSRATVARTLVRLEDPTQPGGPWIIATARRHRHATVYDICADRLASRPPKEQQVTLPPLIVLPTVESQPPFESQNETQTSIVESQIETQDPQFESQNETPTGTPDLDQERTHTPRAREAAEPSPDPALPLIGPTPPPRCQHPQRHAWCGGRVHVPRELHVEFLDRLHTEPGESPGGKAQRLTAFYADTMRHLPPHVAVADAYTFWKAAYKAWVWRHTRAASPVAARAPDILSDAVCPHTPRCATFRVCLDRVVADGRAARQASTG